MELSDLQQGDQILDIGCGTGVLVPLLKKAVGEHGSITELDFSENMLARAKEKHRHITGISYVAADILEYNPEKLFSKITCFLPTCTG